MTEHEWKKEMMDSIIEKMKKCNSCNLCKQRTNIVPGAGNLDSPVMFVGEAPGEDEDKQGIPFVGRAGKLLTKILESVNLKREDVYITNVVKCRPPENRKPLAEEIDACWPYLEAQIAVIKPEIIVTVGSVASELFLKGKTKETITKIRGKKFDWQAGITIIPILHPSYLLRNAGVEEGGPKWLTWQDMQLIKNEYDAIMNKRETDRQVK